MSESLYTVEFQISLLMCLLRDHAFWNRASVSLRITDFGSPALRLVFDTAQTHAARFGALPAPETLVLLVDAALKAPDTSVFVPPDECPLLAHVLHRYLSYSASATETAFYESHLPGYLATMRWNNALQAGSGAPDLLSQAAQLKEELTRVHTGRFKMVKACAPVPEEKRSSGRRYGLGIPVIDSKLAGGLMRQQLGLICAGSGVGKSNLGIGAMAHLTWCKVGCLYITLELTSERINERYQAMLGGIPASWFKKTPDKWPSCYRKRWQAITSDGFKLNPYATVMDMAAGDATIADIDSMINVWKESVTKQDLDADEVCTVVIVDWLDRMSGEGIAKINRNSSEERIWVHIIEKLDQLTKKHNIQLWTSTQAKPEAKGKEFLTSKDIAWGGSKINLMDAAVGLCPKNVDDGVFDAKTGTMGLNDDVVDAPECSRLLNASFMKSRDTGAVDTFVTAYQGPSLRLWNTKEEAMRLQDAIERDPYYGIADLLG